MPEQFGLHQFGRNGAAVESDKGLACPCACHMDRLRHQFLAGPGRPRDQHRRIGRCDPGDNLAQRTDRRAVADDQILVFQNLN